MTTLAHSRTSHTSKKRSERERSERAAVINLLFFFSLLFNYNFSVSRLCICLFRLLKVSWKKLIQKMLIVVKIERNSLHFSADQLTPSMTLCFFISLFQNPSSNIIGVSCLRIDRRRPHHEIIPLPREYALWPVGAQMQLVVLYRLQKQQITVWQQLAGVEELSADEIALLLQQQL